jgi:hypothetical protein
MRRNPARVSIAGVRAAPGEETHHQEVASHDGRASSLKLSTRYPVFFEAAACCCVSELGPIATTPRSARRTATSRRSGGKLVDGLARSRESAWRFRGSVQDDARPRAPKS